MRVFDDVAGVPADFGPSAVSIGKFDGVHRGHRAVIARLREIAQAEGLQAVAVTFDRNPLAFLAPDRCPDSLVSIRQKLDLLATTGLDATLLLRFERELADLAPEAFVERVLVGALAAKAVLVGSDFRFGARGAGDVGLLTRLGQRHGYRVDVIGDVRPDGDRRVSSTWVRELLDHGDVEHAGELLGHAPTVGGIVVHGAARGRELGFPTANLSPDSEGLIPADGIYAGWLTDAGARYPAAISVGDNPTFEGVPKKQVEAYVLDRDLDLYDHYIEVEFTHRIRGMVAFTTIEALIDQIAADVAEVRALLVPRATGG